MKFGGKLLRLWNFIGRINQEVIFCSGEIIMKRKMLTIVIAVVIVLLVGVFWKAEEIAYNNIDHKEFLITKTYSSSEIDKLRRDISCGRMSFKDFMNEYNVECLRKTHEGYYAILMQDDEQNIFVFSGDNFQIKSILTINDFKEKDVFENYVKEGLSMSEVLQFDADVVPNPFSSVYITIHPVREGTFLVRYRREIECGVLSEPVVDSVEYYSLSASSMKNNRYSYVPYILELDRTKR